MLSIVLVSFLAATAPSGAVADADAGALTAAFTRALGTESFLAFEPLAAGHLEGNAWLSVKNVFDRFSCFDIRSARVIRRVEREELTEVEIEIAMTALQSSSGRERIPPQRWILNLVPTKEGPRIAAAYTAERHFARRVLRARTENERAALLEEARTMSYDVFTDIADGITDSLFDGPLNEESFERSYQLAEHLLTAAMTWEDATLEARAWRELATLERIAGTSPIALAYAEAAHGAARRSGNCDLIAAATFTLGSVLLYNFASPEGLELIRAAAGMADSLEDPRVALKAMHNLIVAEFLSWNLVAATEWSLRMSETAARVRWREGEANAAGDMSMIHTQLGEHKAAWRYRLRAYSLHLAGGNRPFAAYTLAVMGTSYASLGDVQTALLLYRRALALTDSPQIRARIAHGMVDLLFYMNRLDEAECTLAEIDGSALPGDLRGRFNASQGWLALHRGRYEEAVALGSIGMNDAFLDERWMAHVLVARALVGLGRDEEARLMYYDTIDRIEEQLAGVPETETLRTRYLGGHTFAYHELAELLLKLGRTREALQIAERVKGRALIDSMQNRRERTPARAQEQAAKAAPIARITELNRELLSRRARGKSIDDIEQEVERVRHELSRVEAEIAFRVQRREEIAEQLTLTDALSAVRADTAAIEFLVGEKQTSVFLITRDGEKVDVRAHSVATAELVPLVERHLHAVRLRSGEERERAQALYKLLLAPFDTELRSRPSLHIVPDGILWQVPFQALRDARGGLLVDRWNIAYAPSLTTLALSGRKRRSIDARANLVAFGNPRIANETVVLAQSRFRNLPLAPLPEANQEVRTIAAMYRKAAVFTGAMATEEEVKSRVASCDVLHIATHGMMDDDEPMHSALVFTPSRYEDGLLETRELLQMEIGAGLAVLSACDTARGAQTAGEGVVGLSWALQVAGCPTTVVSLWKAESRAASTLMIEFHRAMLTGKSIPEALRIAQRSLRRDARFEHPFYWAPFIVIGSP